MVRLKCGGPDMIVVALTPAYVPDHTTHIPCAFCVFEEEHRFYERAYPLYALDIIQKDRRHALRRASTYVADSATGADGEASPEKPPYAP